LIFLKAYWNYQRKCVIGFSVSAFVCDFTGGAFSIAQNIVDKVDGSKRFYCMT